MDRIYRLEIHGKRGSMYSVGVSAATVELAKQAPGTISCDRTAQRLCVVMMERLPGYWTDSAGQSHHRWDNPIIVEIESTPGEWSIGPSAL